MSKVRIALALAVSSLAGVGIAAAAAPSTPAGSGPAAEALASAPVPSGNTFGPAAARAKANAAGVPLPAGGTFNGVQFEQGGDAIEPEALESVLEYNAACQWLRAWRDGRDGALALRVLQAAPRWPFVRGTESGEFLAQVAADAAAGGGPTATSMLRQCDESHEREVAYARRLGLTASR